MMHFEGFVMTQNTIESLTSRIEILERELAEQKAAHSSVRQREWRNVVGISEDNEFTRSMLAEIEANSHAEWLAAQTEPQS
jgi:hypothetical protein